MAVVMLREPSAPALEVITGLRGAPVRRMPIVALGDVPRGSRRRPRDERLLATPTFMRDVVNVAKLNARTRRTPTARAAASPSTTASSICCVRWRRSVALMRAGLARDRAAPSSGSRTAAVSATVHALQSLPALHHVLLWEEAAVSVPAGPPKPEPVTLSAQELLDECERFLRDFAHAARDLGPPNPFTSPARAAARGPRGCSPTRSTPLLRAVRRQARPADVVEESPFRIFDTLRMIRRLVEGGVLTTRTARRPTGPQQRIRVRSAPLNGRGTGPQSMLGQWAMAPDQRGVVGDRRSPSRPLLPFGAQSLDQPGRGNDRRKPSQPFKPFATRGRRRCPRPGPD